MVIVDLFWAGGVVIWPLLAFSVVAIALIYSLFATLSIYWLKHQLVLSLPDSTASEAFSESE